MFMANKKILFIEDDPDQLLIYSNRLNLEGFSVITADDGKKGIQLARRQKPRLILLDLILRNKNGLDTLERIKKDSQIKDIPVIIFTNFDTRESKERAGQLGALEYVVKTQVTPSEMIKKIKKALK